MSIAQDIVELEREIEAAEIFLERRKKAERLTANPDFQDLFVKGYFLHDAARLVQCSTDPNMPKENREAALEEARATGYMRRHLSDIYQMGANAERSLPDMRANLEELRGMAVDE